MNSDEWKREAWKHSLSIDKEAKRNFETALNEPETPADGPPLNRAERRRLQREGKEGRAVNGWADHPSPAQLKRGDGWFGEFRRVLRSNDSEYVVMIRDVVTDWGPVKHAAMRNAAGTDIPWREKQRIKNEIFGRESVAVEVFPKESELIDGANMYHIWIIPDVLPFGLTK